MCVVRNNQPFVFRDLRSVLIAATVVVKDSTQQQQQQNPSSTEPEQEITIEASSYEVTLDQGSATAVWRTSFATNSEGSLNLSLAEYRPAYAATRPPIYIRVVVVGGAPTLVGRSLKIGPITFATGGGAAAGSCTTSINAPLVVANFYLSVANFTASINKTTASIAQLLGIEQTRVSIKNYSSTVGIQPSTKQKWTGTKATLQFADPTPTSANRASSAALAAQFVALRPDCQETPLPLANVYVENAEYGCNVGQFMEGVNKSQMCALNGDGSQCSCYNTYLIDPFGVICVDEDRVREVFMRQCKLLSTCFENSIQEICQKLLSSEEGKYAWAFYGFGGLVFVAIVGYVAAKKVVFHVPKTTLSRQDR
jgi:hypothetical protein